MAFLDDVYDKAVLAYYRAVGKPAPGSAKEVRFPGLTAKGIEGRSLGAHLYVEAPPEFEASSIQPGPGIANILKACSSPRCFKPAPAPNHAESSRWS